MRICIGVAAALAASLASFSHAAAQQSSDDELINNAMSAAPRAVGENATIIALNKDGSTRTLKEGTNNFTCFTDDPATAANDPMCLDENGLAWAEAWMSKTEPPEGKIGFGYMLAGGGTPSNVDPYATEPPEGREPLDEPPHVMIFNTADAMQGYPDPGEDVDPSQPWVMWGGTPYEHLMIPVE